MHFYEKINQNSHLLNKNEEEFLRYFIEKKDSIKNLTIKVASHELFIAPNTIVRMCKKLGFNGYSSFKEAILQNCFLQKSTLSAENVLDNQLQRTKKLLNPKTIQDIVRLIHISEKILLLGVGLSRPSANELNDLLQMIGLNSKTFIDPHFTLYNCSLLSKNDLVIAFSASGKTKSIINAVNISTMTKATTVSITGLSNNTLSNISNYQLYADIREVKFKGIDISNRLPFSYLVNIIFNEYLCNYFADN